MTDAGAETLPALIDSSVRRAGTAPALVAGGISVSYCDLAKRSGQIAAGLAAAGVRPGDIVLLWMANGRDWMEAFLACARAGATAFAVNTRFRAFELADILARTRPRAVVYRASFRGIDFAALLEEACTRAGWRPPISIEGGADTAGGLSLADLAGAGLSVADGVPYGPGPEPDSPAILFSTSGTTSAPKFVVHTHRSIVRHARDVSRDFGMTETGTVMLQALPYCGVFGFCQAMAALDAGRPTVVTETFDAAEAAGLIGRFGVTHFNATDDMLEALVAVAPDGALGSLRLVGAASFNRGAEALSLIARGHGIPVVGLYGMSEVQALFARRSVADPPARRFLAGGRPVSGEAAVRVRDPETGRLCAAGQTGELELRGPSRFEAYHDDVTASARAIDDDGFVRTGDLGMLDEDGAFTFLGRKGDVLRLGGFLVNPNEIADFIAAMDGIAGCQVVDVTVEGRSRAAAFVVMVPGRRFEADPMLSACRRNLAPFKVPVLIHAMEEFPVTQGPNGIKIQRGKLRQLAKAVSGK